MTAIMMMMMMMDLGHSQYTIERTIIEKLLSLAHNVYRHGKTEKQNILFVFILEVIVSPIGTYQRFNVRF